MKRFIIPLLFSCLLASRAEARFERSSAVARSEAAGGAFVSVADDASAIFVNPAGMALAARLAAYADYDEPPLAAGARESRISVAAGGRRVSAGLGWYRLAAADESDNLLLAGVAYRFLEGSQGSLVSVGVNAALGTRPAEGMVCPAAIQAGCPPRRSSTGITGDFGVMVRPLPVISLGFSACNLFGADPGRLAAEAPWGRTQQWGASYFWEDRVAVSFAAEHRNGEWTLHYGLSVKTAVPIEILTGFSDAHATGGIRWSGRRFGAVVAFSTDEARQVTWTAGCELRTRSGMTGGAL